MVEGRKEATAAVLGGAERGGGENSGGMTGRATDSSAIPFTVQFDDGENEEEGYTISDDGRLE